MFLYVKTAGHMSVKFSILYKDLPDNIDHTMGQ